MRETGQGDSGFIPTATDTTATAATDRTSPQAECSDTAEKNLLSSALTTPTTTFHAEHHAHGDEKRGFEATIKVSPCRNWCRAIMCCFRLVILAVVIVQIVIYCVALVVVDDTCEEGDMPFLGDGCESEVNEEVSGERQLVHSPVLDHVTFWPLMLEYYYNMI